MRVNYNVSGAAITVVPATQSGRWYHFRCEIDLGTGMLNVRVDGVLVASNIQMHPGPISALALTGWDLPGVVSLDNLIGKTQ